DDLKRPYEESLAQQKLAALPEPIRLDTKAAMEIPADNRNEVQKYLASKFESLIKVKPEEMLSALSADDRVKYDTLNQQVPTLGGQKKSWGNLQVVYDVGPPSPTHVLRRGN